MPRQILTDECWLKLKAMMLKMNIYNKPTLRLTTEGILYRIRVGCPWRDLPVDFGAWNTVYKRFNEWPRSKKRLQIFSALIVEPDLEWSFVDGSIVKAHQHSSGAISGNETAIAQSVASHTTKIQTIGYPFTLL